MLSFYSTFLDLLPEWLRPCTLKSIHDHSILVANGVVVFHILTFIVWGIIFAKDLMMPVRPPIGDRKKEQ